MKALIFASVFLTTASSFAFGQAPTLTVTDRVETSPAFGRPVLIQEKDGSSTLVQLEALADDKFNLRLVAYGKGGKVLAEGKASKPEAGENLYLDSAVRNGAGELVVVTNYSRQTGTSGKMFSDNLTRRVSALIVQGSFPRLVDRIRVGDKNLALVSNDLGRGPGEQDNSLLRFIDEDTGKVFSQSFLTHPVSGKLGINSRNQVVAVLMGYELFGLLDTQTGKFTDLIPERKQPSQYPGLVELSIGSFITIGDEDSLRLLDTAALMDGEMREVRSFAHQPSFLGDFVVERKDGGLVVSDLRFGMAQGPAIEDTAEGRAQKSITSVTQTPLGLIAVTSRFKVPNSFMTGTILEYVNVATGEILRTTENSMNTMTGRVLVKGAQVLTMEVRDSFGNGRGYELVDLATGRSVAKGEELLWNVPLQLESGRILALKANERKQVCVIDLINPAEESCVEDPLVGSDPLRYGSETFAIGENGKLRLPLLESKGDKQSLRSRGFIDLKITE